MAPGARRPGAQEPEESCGAIAEACEHGGELVEIDRALPPGWLVEASRISFRTGAARRELLARDALEIGGVNEELTLGNADGQDVGDMLVGDGVAVALPLDEPVDAGEAVDDASGVVRMSGEGQELVLIFGAEPLERSAASTGVDDPVEPGGKLSPDVIEVTEGATIEEGALELPSPGNAVLAQRPLRTGTGSHHWTKMLTIAIPAHSWSSALRGDFYAKAAKTP